MIFLHFRLKIDCGIFFIFPCFHVSIINHHHHGFVANIWAKIQCNGDDKDTKKIISKMYLQEVKPLAINPSTCDETQFLLFSTMELIMNFTLSATIGSSNRHVSISYDIEINNIIVFLITK